MITRQSVSPATADGICGEQGYQSPIAWAGPDQAGRVAAWLAAVGPGEVTRNPHLDHEWAREAVASPALVATVTAVLGPAVAVENSFLIVKQPGTAFAVPAHQDGINDRIVLDPARSVTAWLALTDATIVNGCLQVIPGSQRHGYLPYHRAEPATSNGHQRPLTTSGDFGEQSFVPLPLPGGQACLMDVRLVHRSGPNRSRRPRMGLNVRYVAPRAVTCRDGTAVDLFVLTGTSW